MAEVSKIIGKNISDISEISNFQKLLVTDFSGSNAAYIEPTLLLHFDGADGATNFPDSSVKCYSPSTIGGNVQIDTAQSKFGGSSCLFDGNGDYLAYADSNDWDFGYGDFTIDFWIYPTNANWTDYKGIVGGTGISAGGWAIYTYNSAVLRLSINGATTDLVTSGNQVLTLNQWNHIALIRKGTGATDLNFYINGVGGDTPATGNVIIDSANLGLVIGRYYTNYDGVYSTGWLDEFRIVRGKAIWTSNFTPPTLAYPSLSKPVLLLHFDEADASTNFPDSSGNYHSVSTIGGNAQIDTAQSKFGGSSCLFDGNGDYLAYADSNDWYLDGDFTIDFWVRFNALPGEGSAQFFCKQDTDANNYWFFSIWPSGGVQYLDFAVVSSGVTIIQITVASSGLSINTWYHFAVTRNENNFRIFQDGTQQGNTVTDSSLMPNFSGPLIIGANASALYSLNGWLDEFRILKGKAAWTSNFTPPNSAYSSFHKPVLLMHFDDADGSTNFIDSSDWNNTITVAGSVQIDTAQYKFGSASLYSGNINDYITAPDSDNWHFDGDFTIDCWARFGALPTSGNQIIFVVQIYNGSNMWRWGIYNQSGTQKLFFVLTLGGSDLITMIDTVSIGTDTWYHFAVTRNGDSFKSFLNGTQVGSLTNSNKFSNLAIPLRIAWVESGSIWLDEFRIVKGKALWTSAFSAPNEQYKNIIV